LICVGGVARRWRSEEQGGDNELAVELHLMPAALSLMARGNCPLWKRFGLLGAAGSGFILRVGFPLPPAAYQWVLQMQSGQLLETVLCWQNDLAKKNVANFFNIN
jgi:hypothetical protein